MTLFIRLIVYALGIYAFYLELINFKILKTKSTSKTIYLNIGLLIIMGILTYGCELKDGLAVIQIVVYLPCFIKIAVEWYKKIP